MGSYQILAVYCRERGGKRDIWDIRNDWDCRIRPSRPVWRLMVRAAGDCGPYRWRGWLGSARPARPLRLARRGLKAVRFIEDRALDVPGRLDAQ